MCIYAMMTIYARATWKKIGINLYRRPPSDNLMKSDTRLTNWEAPDNGTNKQMVDGTDN